MQGMVEIMKTILFQGDSITDANRDREGNNKENVFGQGCVRILPSRILCYFPGTEMLAREWYQTVGGLL